MIILGLLLWSIAAWGQRGEFLSVDQFRSEFSAQESPAWHTLWLKTAQREAVESILGRRFPALRLRYLGEGQRTAWVLEEVGKEMPITFGVIVNGGAIERAAVLVYRESRGGEVRHDFFTRQFAGAELQQKGSQWQLSQHIDGITGATLSVRAMKRVAMTAIYLHGQTPFAADQVALSRVP